MDSDKKPRKIFDHPDFEIYWPKRITWVGFLIAWVVVFATILITLFLARLGS